MNINPPAGNAPNATITNAAAAAELPASLQHLPRGTLLTALVQSSSPLPTQGQIVATSQTLAQNPQPASSSSQPQTSTTGQSQNRAFNVLLNIGGSQVQTRSNSAFNVGQLLKIEITANAGLRVIEVINKTPPLDQSLIQLQQGLRQALPLQQSPRLLLNNLVPLFQLLQQLPASPAKAQIRELLATIPDLKQLANPATLKNSVNQSGLFLEAKIKLIQGKIQQLLQNNQPQSPSPLGQNTQNNSSVQQPPPPQGAAVREQLQNLLRENPQLGRQLEQAIGQDFKSQLLKLSSTLLPLLSQGDGSPATAKPAETALLQRILQVLPDTRGSSLAGTPASSDLSKLSLSNLPINTQLHQLLNPHLTTPHPTPQQAAANQSSSLDLAVSTVLRQIAASLAHVQASQLQSLVAPRTDADGGQLLNSWNLEIPVLLDGQFKPIQLHINEERDPDTSSQNSEQRRIWKITLGFDFEELGEFFATLKVIDTTISATFWSDKPATLQRISNELQHLNKLLSKLGLNVEELDCRYGKPTIRETRLDQHLVDIKT